MQSVEIRTATGESRVVIGERLANLGTYLPARGTVIITDHTVADHYGGAFPPAPVIRIGTGEGIKTLETCAQIYEALLAREADRATFIAGIGGGIACDIAGFVASTYLRGVRFGFAATTLLSQADASVGGKNGVNFSGYKNMVGVFKQPEFVLCDPELLKTLPAREILSGLGEIVKHALIGDPDMFAFLEEHGDAALALEPVAVERLIHDSVVLKAAIVNRDERESGERRKLNFGHTFGHAVERVSGISHGEAVAAGMAVALDISARLGLMPAGEARRSKRLLERLGLPVRTRSDPQTVLEALGKDKKRLGDLIHFVCLEGIGRAVVRDIPLEELAALFKELA